MELRRGRCAEFSVLYVAACLANGIEARYVRSYPPDDHIWAEVNIGSEWLMVETVDGYVSDPLKRFNQGFNVTYVVSFEPYRMENVTHRYIR